MEENVPRKVQNKYQQSDNKWQIVSKSAETKPKTYQILKSNYLHKKCTEVDTKEGQVEQYRC